jgi:hypothetical protein
VLQQGQGRIVTVPHTLLQGRRWRHPAAGTVKEQPAQQVGRALQAQAVGYGVFGQLRLDRLKGLPVNNGLVTGGVDLAAVRNLANIAAALFRN